ncbi:MAG: hypothetical protein ABR594_02680, partial [Pyrinomonadaceae bacterium]
CQQADVRALSSENETGLIVSGGGTANTLGLTLEQPPAQNEEGGGLNSTLSANTITLLSPLGPGESINFNFLLGVEQTGLFRFYVNVEVLSGPPPQNVAPSSKVRPRRRSARKN